MSATNSATVSATGSWQAADAFSDAQGGAGQVSTPRWPGAIPSTEHELPGDVPGPFGTAPGGASENPYAAGMPAADYGTEGLTEPYSDEGSGLAGIAAPNAVPGHGGFGGNAQVMSEHGGSDRFSRWFSRPAAGNVHVPAMRNLLTRRMPTDWRKVYDSTGQLVSYTFNRPSLQVQQMVDAGDSLNEHQVDYESSPIYSRLAYLAREQDAVESVWAPSGQTPDLTPYQDNTGNPVYDAPPDPVTTSGNQMPASGDYGYSFGDMIYG